MIIGVFFYRQFACPIFIKEIVSMKKRMSLLLVFMLMINICSPFVVAVDYDENNPEPIIEEYININDFSCGLSILSGGNARCSGYARSRVQTDSVHLTVCLKRQNSNGSWSTVVAWSSTHICDNGLTKHQYVTSGYNYQVVATVDIYSSSGVHVEHSVKSSQIVYY